MKKLLTLLLLSPIAFADPVNLDCEYYKTLDMDTFKTTKISSKKSFTIQPSTKDVITENGSFPYTEKGNLITWQAFSVVKVGDVYAFANIYTLDRVTGEMKTEFRDKYNEVGFESPAIFSLLDPKSYELAKIYNAKCKKVEALF